MSKKIKWSIFENEDHTFTEITQLINYWSLKRKDHNLPFQQDIDLHELPHYHWPNLFTVTNSIDGWIISKCGEKISLAYEKKLFGKNLQSQFKKCDYDLLLSYINNSIETHQPKILVGKVKFERKLETKFEAVLMPITENNNTFIFGGFYYLPIFNEPALV